jgi:hypothetical protein
MAADDAGRNSAESAAASPAAPSGLPQASTDSPQSPGALLSETAPPAVDALPDGVEWHAPGAGERALYANMAAVGALPERPREYALDAQALLAFCRGPFTDAIVRSGVSHYLEFKAVDATHFAAGDGAAAERVPCSRADVFKTKALGLVEKRVLMMFLSGSDVAAAKPDDGVDGDGGDGDNGDGGGGGGGPGDSREPDSRAVESESGAGDGAGEGVDSGADSGADSGVDSGADSGARTGPADPHARAGDAALDAEFPTLGAFLRGRYKFTDRLVEIVSHAIALCPRGPESTVSEGLRGTRRYLAALGRYGATAFLAPYYGVGEWPQAFCRLAAVEGAVYMLGTRVVAFGCSAGDSVAQDGQPQITHLRYEMPDGKLGLARVRAVVAGPEHLGAAWLPSGAAARPAARIARAAVFTRGSLRVAAGNRDEIATVVVPPGRISGAGAVGSSDSDHGSSDHGVLLALQIGAQCGVCPAGVRVVHLTVPAAPGASAAEALALLPPAIAAIIDNGGDSESNGSSDTDGNPDDNDDDDSKNNNNDNNNNNNKKSTIWSVSYTIEPIASSIDVGAEIDAAAGSQVPANLVRVARPGTGAHLTVDHVVAEAASTFRAAARLVGLGADAEFLPPPARTHEEAMLEAELAAEIEEVQKRKNAEQDGAESATNEDAES